MKPNMWCIVFLSFCSANKSSTVRMPAAIERLVRKQNIQFMHNKNHFSMEYFQFIKKLLTCNQHHIQIQPGHDKLVSGALWTCNLYNHIQIQPGHHLRYKTTVSSARERLSAQKRNISPFDWLLFTNKYWRVNEIWL